MKPLREQARRVISDGSAADVSVPGDQDRIWHTLYARLDAPLPPLAAEANRALKLARLGAPHPGASVLLKLVLGVAVLGGLGGGLWWYEVRRAPSNAPAPLRQLAVAAYEPPSLPTTPAVASPPAQRAADERAVVQRPRHSAPKQPSLAAETQLVAMAQSALSAGDAARALALIDRHRREYPRGALLPEREAARVLSLCALGHAAEAQAARLRFERSWPTSPLLSRVRASCRSGLE